MRVFQLGRLHRKPGLFFDRTANIWCQEEMFAGPEKISLTWGQGCASSFNVSCRLGRLKTELTFLINSCIRKSLLVFVAFFFFFSVK